MKVLHLSTYAGGSGAGRAAYSLHAALRHSGVDSRMLVARSTVTDPHVSQVSGSTQTRWRLAQRADRALWRLQRSPNTSWRSPAFFGVDIRREIDRIDPDVINLHWVTNGFLSIEQIGRIDRPIVWSLYDMWPFSGTEHYGSLPERTDSGYRTTNRPAGDTGFDLDRWAWERKRKNWLNPMHVVAASRWLEERAHASALMRQWPIERIPHAIDPGVFCRGDTAEARTRWGLEPHQPTIAFLASAGLSDHRKGGDVLLEALQQLRDQESEAQVVIVGPGTSNQATGLSNIRWIPEVRRNSELQSLYAAASVVAVPSREDTLPLVALEAHMCGVPVVASDIGGLPDAIEAGVSGELVAPGDPAALARALAHFVNDPASVDSQRIRDRAVRLWSYESVAQQYTEVFATASTA